MAKRGVDVTIRKVRPDDYPRIEEILRAAFSPIFANFRDAVGPSIAPAAFDGEEEEQRLLLADFCADGGDSQVFVALTGGKIAGFVTVLLDRERSLGEIGLNAVDPLHANRGVATRMYVFALACMREAGMRAATVGTGGDPNHAAARAAYAKAGFDKAIPNVHLYRIL